MGKGVPSSLVEQLGRDGGADVLADLGRAQGSERRLQSEAEPGLPADPGQGPTAGGLSEKTEEEGGLRGEAPDCGPGELQEEERTGLK